jgi:uncharacterized protein (DUF58 family)
MQTLTQPFENLEFLARQVVEGFIVGLHKSPFHGFSVEFAEYRLYNRGDNLKHIDWKVFGRTDKLFTKKYEEETNLRCQLVLDVSSSMLYPQEDQQTNKLQFSLLSAAAILSILKKQLDAGGITFFDNNVLEHTPCKSNPVHYRHLYTLLENKLKYKAPQQQTSTAKVLHQLAEQLHKRSLVVIFSDMLDTLGDLNAMLDALQHLRHNKHEVVMFLVQDKQHEVEFQFPNRPYEFTDLESGEKIKLNSTDIQTSYREQMQAYREKLTLHCGQFGIDWVDADIREGYDQILKAYLLKRNKMM